MQRMNLAAGGTALPIRDHFHEMNFIEFTLTLSEPHEPFAAGYQALVIIEPTDA